MPRRTSDQDKNHPITKTRLLTTKDEAARRLTDQIELGEKLTAPTIRSEQDYEQWLEEVGSWRDFACELLSRLFDSDEFAGEFARAVGGRFWSGMALQDKLEQNLQRHKSQLHRLRSIKQRLALIEEPDIDRAGFGPDASGPRPRTAFVVHGRDEAAKEAVARFLEKLGIQVIILHEQPSRSKTLIEKFETYAEDVGFAVVLLTPDDRGFLATEPDKIEARARQNVVFELGFFVGKLGREYVAALCAPGVARPSDIDGIIYIPYDSSGSWRVALAREIKAANIAVDLNKAV